MKTFTRTILAAGAFIFGAFATQAQTRSVDLSIATITAPAAGAVIAQGQAVTLDLTITHSGPDTLRQGDSILITGGPIASGSAIVAVLSQGFPVGASLTLSTQDPIYTNERTEANDENVQWCFQINSVRAASGGTPVADNNAANNESCVNVTLKGRTTSILEVNKNVVKADAFPNPTTGEVNIKLNTEKAGNTKAVVTDLTGRKVYSQSFQNQPAGTNTYSIDLKGLAHGTYIISLQTADGKKAVSKVQLK